MQKPIAEIWYGITACENNVVRLRETWVDPYLAGNIWVVQGSSRNAVIDTGTGMVSPLPIINAISQKPVIAIACASFYDHAGGLHYFEERACYRADADQIANPTLDSSVVSTFVNESMLLAWPYSNFEIDKYRMIGAPPTLCLDEGDIIDLGDRQLEVLHVPGVDKGSIALWEVATGSLFTCDALYDDPVYERKFYAEDLDALKLSLERLSQLPVKTVYPGHYPCFGREKMLEVIDRILK